MARLCWHQCAQSCPLAQLCCLLSAACHPKGHGGTISLNPGSTDVAKETWIAPYHSEWCNSMPHCCIAITHALPQLHTPPLLSGYPGPGCAAGVLTLEALHCVCSAENAGRGEEGQQQGEAQDEARRGRKGQPRGDPGRGGARSPSWAPAPPCACPSHDSRARPCLEGGGSSGRQRAPPYAMCRSPSTGMGRLRVQGPAQKGPGEVRERVSSLPLAGHSRASVTRNSLGPAVTRPEAEGGRGEGMGRGCSGLGQEGLRTCGAVCEMEAPGSWLSSEGGAVLTPGSSGSASGQGWP